MSTRSWRSRSRGASRLRRTNRAAGPSSARRAEACSARASGWRGRDPRRAAARRKRRLWEIRRRPRVSTAAGSSSAIGCSSASSPFSFGQSPTDARRRQAHVPPVREPASKWIAVEKVVERPLAVPGSDQTDASQIRPGQQLRAQRRGCRQLRVAQAGGDALRSLAAQHAQGCWLAHICEMKRDDHRTFSRSIARSCYYRVY